MAKKPNDKNEGFVTEANNLRVRMARAADVKKLIEVYLNLPHSIRELFHPFPYNKLNLYVILVVMLCSNRLISLLVSLYPRRLSTIIIAEDTKNSQIIGFAFFTITGREESALIANAGLMTIQGSLRTGVGTSMFELLNERAKKIGVGKFRVTVLEKNIRSLTFLERFGYKRKGYTTDEYWNGSNLRNIVMEMEI